MDRQYLTVETTDLAKFICQFKSQFLANKLANKCSQIWGRIGQISLSFYPYEGLSGPQNVSGLQAVLVQSLRDPVESRMKFHSVITVLFLSVVPFAVSILEILPQNDDLVMSGPFEEPD